MMNKNIQSLSPNQHNLLRIDDSQTLTTLGTSHLLYLRANEVTQAVCSFPVFFTKDAVNNQWALSALCAFAVEQNVFVKEGKWTAGYTPKSIRIQPLSLVKSETKEGFDVAINTSHLSVSEQSGEPLYDDAKKPTLFLIEKIRLLESALEDDKLTYTALEKLDQQNLIADVDMIIEFADGTKQAINGLAMPNESHLATIDAQSLLQLQKEGLLMMLHSMLISLFQVNNVIKLHNARNENNKIANIKFETPKSRTAGEAI